MRKLLWYVILNFSILKLHGQRYEHTTFWFKTQLTIPLSKKFDLTPEYTHRQQNDFHISLFNPFARKLLDQKRVWLTYRAKRFTIQLGQTYLTSYPLIDKEADFKIKPTKEFRTSLRLEISQNEGKWTFRERIQGELRCLSTLNYGLTTRYSLKLTTQYQLSDKTRLQFWNESFLNAPPNRAAFPFTQSWSWLGVMYRVSSKVNCDFGYMRNWRRRNALEFDFDNALYTAVNFSL